MPDKTRANWQKFEQMLGEKHPTPDLSTQYQSAIQSDNPKITATVYQDGRGGYGFRITVPAAAWAQEQLERGELDGELSDTPAPRPKRR